MKVCIAEKPSVAREIAFIIGAKKKKDGYYEGNGYQVTWTFGHLCTLKLPDDYQEDWKKWSLATLPILPQKFETKLITKKGIRKQFNTIKKLFSSASVVINCGDAGQEGELIQRWVMQQAKYKGKVQRLWIASLTPEAIRKGFQQLKDASQYDNLYYAGMSRAIGDWILGMNATRLYTLKYGGYKQVLSIGRVQTPTLAMLVNRHHEIENFKPTPYWDLQTRYREVVFNYVKGRFLKREEGEVILQKIREQPFTVLSYEKKKGREYPPRLFDLTSLQVHCNKRYNYSADQTLKIVQKLYEQKLVTYPRVDTTYLPNDVYPKVAGILGKMTNYSQFTQSLLGQKIRKSSKVFNDKKVTDHHAIIPTGIQKVLPDQEQSVYDAIARQFIAAFYPDCIVSHTTVTGEVKGEQFKAKGKEVLEEGWRILFPKKAINKSTISSKGVSKKQEEIILPSFKVGETGAHEPSLIEKQTQPPKYYTEATLLRGMETAGKKVEDEELRELMKENGIGRPSTRANIIETLYRRGYIEKRKKLLMTTDVGIQLIGSIQNDLLKSAELTGKWEKQLRDIARGDYFAKQFIKDMKQMVIDLVAEVKKAENQPKIVSQKYANKFSKRRPKPKNPLKTEKVFLDKKVANKPKIDKIIDLPCPKCYQGKLLKGKMAYGCSRWELGCDFRLPFSYMGKKIPLLQLQRLMKMGSTIQLKGFKEAGNMVTGKLRFDDDFKLILSGKSPAKNQSKESHFEKKRVPDKISCPKCGKGKILKGKTAYGCSRWQMGCDYKYLFEEVRRKAGSKSLTKELVWDILRAKA